MESSELVKAVQPFQIPGAVGCRPEGGLVLPRLEFHSNGRVNAELIGSDREAGGKLAVGAIARFSCIADGRMNREFVNGIGVFQLETLQRRQRLLPGNYTILTPANGDIVLVVETPGQHNGASGDGLVTTNPDVNLGVFTRDSFSVVIYADPSDSRQAVGGNSRAGVAAIHASYLSGSAGVIERTLEVLHEQTQSDKFVAILGPGIYAQNFPHNAEWLESRVQLYAQVAGIDVGSSRAMLAIDRLAARTGLGLQGYSIHGAAVASLIKAGVTVYATGIDVASNNFKGVPTHWSKRRFEIAPHAVDDLKSNCLNVIRIAA